MAYLPLCLTLSRVVLVPLFPILYLYGGSIGFFPLSLILLFLVALFELSDMLDGFFARRLKEVTPLGKVLDPIADSAVRLTILFTFTAPPISLPLLVPLFFFYRDLITSTLRLLSGLRGDAMGARFSGKLKAVVQGVIFVLILGLLALFGLHKMPEHCLKIAALFLALIALVVSWVSAIDYLVASRALLKKGASAKG